MPFKPWIIAAAAALGLAACGETTGNQALAGGAIGAGAAVLVNGSLIKGAAVGAAGNIIFCELNPGRCR